MVGNYLPPSPHLPFNVMSNTSHQPVNPTEHCENVCANPSISPSKAPLSGVSGKRRANDRLNVPSSIVCDSGFVPGDKVFVVDEDPTGAVPKPCLVLLKEQPPKSLADYVVAKDRRIRVTPATLKKCGLQGENFEIDGGAEKIIVRPA